MHPMLSPGAPGDVRRKAVLDEKVGYHRHHSVYSLAQGPNTLDYNNNYQEQDDNPAAKKMDTAGK